MARSATTRASPITASATWRSPATPARPVSIPCAGTWCTRRSKTTGSFVASKPLLNQIHKMIRWSDLTNLHSVPTDCDQRDERMGWMGDAQVSSEGLMLNFDMAAFYTNFLRDMRDDQGADGTMTDTVPLLAATAAAPPTLPGARRFP